MKNSFDVIVICAGHAGCEAAFAAARIGVRVGLCTLSSDTVAHMPCNPAVGGTAKGHLEREIGELAGSLQYIEFGGSQLKTDSQPRLYDESIAFNRQVERGVFALERGDDPPVLFSFLSSPAAL